MTASTGSFAGHEPEFSTAISRVEPGRILVRGYDVGDLIRHASGSEAAFLALTGRRPSARELRLFDALLCTCVDHGLVNTLAVAGRYVMSGSASLPAAMAAGALCFGPYTGTANLTAELLTELVEAGGEVPDDATIDSALRRRREADVPIPGLGHPVHREVDPRTVAAREVAEREGFVGPKVVLLDRVHARAAAVVGRQLVLNVDGLMGALLLEMEFGPEEILAVNIILAMPGIAAHAIEEARYGRRLRYPLDHAASYRLPAEPRRWEEAGEGPQTPRDGGTVPR
jgi:citrate synthase